MIDLILYQQYVLRALHVNILAFHFPPFNPFQFDSVFVLLAPDGWRKQKRFYDFQLILKQFTVFFGFNARSCIR